MYSQYFLSRRWALSAYGLGSVIVALWLANALLNLRLNDWSKRFYDAMEDAVKGTSSIASGSTMEVLRPLFLEWSWMSGLFVLSKPVINFLTRYYGFCWREALTADYLYRWRVARKGSKASEVEGASQRVQDDCYQLAVSIDSLAQGLLAALLQLLTFTPLLWSLSSGLPGAPEGLLVWVAYGCNLLGYMISALVGIKLIGLEYRNQSTEAAFRKELVFAEDETPGRATLPVCAELFRAVRRNYHTLFLHLGYFELWSAIFGKAMELLPMLLLAPHVFSSAITFGTYMQAVNAFSSVQDGLSMVIQRWVEINTLLSVMRRLSEFEAALPPHGDERAVDETSRLLAAGGAAAPL